MNLRRMISAFMLLLAVWFPLDNALAGAVVQGCPMMSHAFERGLEKTLIAVTGARDSQAQPSLSIDCHSTVSTASRPASSPILYHCVNGCEHCSLCLLLGTMALPIGHPGVPLTPVLPEKISSFPSSAHPAVSGPLFRPPII